MKKFAILIMMGVAVGACNSGPSLQKYFVENTENKNFTALDISPSILGLDKSKLTVTQSEALATFEKMNILVFKLDTLNSPMYESEKAKVKEILKDKKYQQLMKFGSGGSGASVSFIGDENHIDEFILFAHKRENGFAIIRILGKDMNPTGITELMSILKDANIDIKQFEPLNQMLKQGW